MLLTPGEDGECGGGTAGTWPSADSQSGHYLWHTTAADSVVSGETTGATSADLARIPQSYIIPTKVRIVIQTGGGASFGWEKQNFLVR